MMKKLLTAAALFGIGASVSTQAQDDVQIRIEPVAGNVYVLYGRGGNIGVHTGPDGVFLIDDQFAPLTDKILTAIKTVSEEPVRYVINTHFHGDHSGGNENLGKQGTLIMSHDKVRPRLLDKAYIKAFDFQMDATKQKGLPVVTFNDKLSLHLNGEEARAHHVPHAHTDGDSIVYFKGSNVIHMGDTYWSMGFPFFDVPHGGSIDGMIGAADTALSLGDENTKVIPGHGPVTGKDGLRDFRALLIEAKKRIGDRKSSGASLAELQESDVLDGITDKFPTDTAWAKKFIGFVYSSL